MRIITREKGLLLAVVCLAACLVGAVLAVGGTVLKDAAAAENQALDQATLSWVESDGQHVKEKNLFETERVTYTLPVNVNGVKFQIWNCTTQTNEAEVTSNDSQISVSLLKDHNYIFFCMDKTYQVQTNRNLYVWARGTDGKLVSTKSMTKTSATAESVWSYTEIK